MLNTNDQLKELGQQLSAIHPEWFPRGLRSLSAQSMDAGYAETLGWDRIVLSNVDYERPGFAPAWELAQALSKIRAGQILTFTEEYAVEILWHEINHLRATRLEKPSRLAETVTQFISRHTYSDLLQVLGAAPAHQANIIENGYAYNVWVANFRTLLSKHGITESSAVEGLLPRLLMATDETLGIQVADWLAARGGGKTSQWRKALAQLDLTAADFGNYVGRIWFRGYSMDGRKVF